MPKQTVFNRLEMDEHGVIMIRLQKQFVDEDGSVIDMGWHRTAIDPGGDLEATLADVNTHLLHMKVGGLKETPGLKAVKRLVPAVHTEEIVSEFRKKISARP